MMEWDRMRNAWQARADRPGEGRLPLPSDARWLRRTIRRRDLLETVVAVAMALIFTAMVWPLWSAGLVASALFSAWLAASCILIVLRLRRARALFPARDGDLSLSEFLARERRALEHQRRLLASVRWWYVGPIVFGVVGFFMGFRGLHWHSAAYAAIVLTVGFLIERANRMAVRESIEPAIAALEEQIRQLDATGESE